MDAAEAERWYARVWEEASENSNEVAAIYAMRCWQAKMNGRPIEPIAEELSELVDSCAQVATAFTKAFGEWGDALPQTLRIT